jgi:NADP-dependent 3-hydroxy acid dehydrogenase YdfG
MKAFANRTAVVTGGGSGVGAAIALALSAEGADVCLVGRRLDRLEAVAAKARAFNTKATCFSADLTDEAQLLDLAQRFKGALEFVDILVHSAGMVERAAIECGSVQGFDSHYRLNVRAPYALTQCLLPMLKARRGEVVFINSSSALKAKALFAQYDATKHALRALADSLREEVNRDGVRVLSVYLGRTASEMQQKLHAEEGKVYKPELLVQPQDVAAAVLGALRLPRTAEVTEIHIRPMVKA